MLLARRDAQRAGREAAGDARRPAGPALAAGAVAVEGAGERFVDLEADRAAAARPRQGKLGFQEARTLPACAPPIHGDDRETEHDAEEEHEERVAQHAPRPQARRRR